MSSNSYEEVKTDQYAGGTTLNQNDVAKQLGKISNCKTEWDDAHQRLFQVK